MRVAAACWPPRWPGTPRPPPPHRDDAVDRPPGCRAARPCAGAAARPARSGRPFSGASAAGQPAFRTARKAEAREDWTASPPPASRRSPRIRRTSRPRGCSRSRSRSSASPTACSRRSSARGRRRLRQVGARVARAARAPAVPRDADGRRRGGAASRPIARPFLAALAARLDRDRERRPLRVRSPSSAVVSADAHVRRRRRRASAAVRAVTSRARVRHARQERAQARRRHRRSRAAADDARPTAVSARRDAARGEHRRRRDLGRAARPDAAACSTLSTGDHKACSRRRSRAPARRVARGLRSGGARLHRVPPDGISADWDDQGLASAIRIGTSNRVVTVPGQIDGNTIAWSPDRAHLAFVAQLDDHCDAATRSSAAAFVADAATGAVDRARARGQRPRDRVGRRSQARDRRRRRREIRRSRLAQPTPLAGADGLLAPRRRRLRAEVRGASDRGACR